MVTEEQMNLIDLMVKHISLLRMQFFSLELEIQIFTLAVSSFFLTQVISLSCLHAKLHYTGYTKNQYRLIYFLQQKCMANNDKSDWVSDYSYCSNDFENRLRLVMLILLV
jgi:hypothetical protein